MKNTATRALFAHWDQRRGERAAPERADIDPAVIPGILADTFILAIDGQGDAVFRLVGSRIQVILGAGLKGSPFVHLWPADRRDEARTILSTVMDETSGIVAGLHGETVRGRHLPLELLLLPLRHNGRTHSRLLGSLSSAEPPLMAGLDPVAGLAVQSLRIIRTTAGDGPWPPPGPPRIQRGRLTIVEGGLSSASL